MSDEEKKLARLTDEELLKEAEGAVTLFSDLLFVYSKRHHGTAIDEIEILARHTENLAKLVRDLTVKSMENKEDKDGFLQYAEETSLKADAYVESQSHSHGHYKTATVDSLIIRDLANIVHHLSKKVYGQ